MKTTICIYLIFSAIIAIKAEDNSEEYEEYDESYEVQDVQQNTAVKDAESFRYTPSQRLKQVEDSLPAGKKNPIDNNNFKATMINTFVKSMKTKVAVDGLAKLTDEWDTMIGGPEASRVIGTMGRNLNRVLTSPAGSDFISALLTTAHVLLSKAGDGSRDSGLSLKAGDESRDSAGLGKLLSMAFSMFTSPEMPELINNAGGLIVQGVDKPNAAAFLRQIVNEGNTMLLDQRLPQKLDKCFGNLMNKMNKSSGGSQPATPANRAPAKRTYSRPARSYPVPNPSARK